ncbi:hypothetical protein BKI52_38795 [marine bacterium AO1-C]|nr:hypothetical protein BKI52_38795 [marine bacterium AO1-C]
MKKRLLITLLSFATFALNAQGIKFCKGNWATIKAKAKAENKYIFVDAYTTWCGPCKWLSKDIFPQKKVGDFFNKHYVSYKFDMEKGEGVKFAQKYQVNLYPTMLYFTPEGELVHKTVGACAAETLIKRASNGLDAEKQFYVLKRRFKQGERNSQFLKNYIEVLGDAKENLSEPMGIYFAQIDKKDWASNENWAFIKKYERSALSNIFSYVFTNRAKFAEANGSNKVNGYILQVLVRGVKEVVNANNQDQLDAFVKKLQAFFGSDAQRRIARTKHLFYARNQPKSFQYTYDYFDNYCNDVHELNRIASDYCEKFEEQLYLEKALGWVEKSIKLDKRSFNTYTQAQLLYKLKRYKRAKKAAKESIRLAQKEGKSFKNTRKLLNEIKRVM